MEQPLVSIIIPTYNRAHLIGETLDSVLAQTYSNWECIVVDDGSSDNTPEVLAAYCAKDSRFQYHKRPLEKPKGANACRNYGFELSKGEYVNWFDSDDVMVSEKLETQVKELQNSTFDYTICQTMRIDLETKKELGLRALKLKSNNIFEDYILNRIFWLTGAPLWKKRFLIDNQLNFDETLQQAQDYDFHMCVLSISQNYYANDTPFVLFKHHRDNMSNSIYDEPLKLFSNVKVKYKILVKYSSFLGHDAKVFILGELVKLYSVVVRERYKRMALRACFYVLNIYLKHKELFPYNGLRTSFYAISPLIYTFSTKGFKLTKRVNKIIDYS